MRLLGTIGPDWFIRRGMKPPVSPALIAEWRDRLELELRDTLEIDVDLVIAERTRFSLPREAAGRTVIEVENFARNSLDRFLSSKYQF